MKVCSFGECVRTVKGRGLCKTHYQHALRGREPYLVRSWISDPVEYLWRSTSVSDPLDCWRWLLSINGRGYGNVARRFRAIGNTAHRLSFAIFRGPIPDGLTIDHLCRNRWCVNPLHLEAVSSRVNTLRGYSPTAVAYRTGVCVKGLHLLEGNNLTHFTNGTRACRSCRLETRRIWYARTRAAAREALADLRAEAADAEESAS